MNAQARHDAALPWVIRYTHGSDQPVLAGQLTVNNIIGGAAMTGSIGYWVDERWAGRGSYRPRWRWPWTTASA